MSFQTKNAMQCTISALVIIGAAEFIEESTRHAFPSTLKISDGMFKLSVGFGMMGILNGLLPRQEVIFLPIRVKSWGLISPAMPSRRAKISVYIFLKRENILAPNLICSLKLHA